MLPSVGRIVHYQLSESDAGVINHARDENSLTNAGNRAAEGQTFPAIVVRTFGGDAANLQVLLDGNDTHWATSRGEGDQPGTWTWPPRV